MASVTRKALSFNNLSIRAKLLWIVVLTSGVALGVAGVAIVTYDSLTFTRQKLNDLSTQAEILGSISEAALDFNDAKAAREYLSSLKARPDIVSGVIYDSAGQVFASYFRKDSDGGRKLTPPPKAEADGHRSEDGDLLLFRHIARGNEVLGTVYLRANLEQRARSLGYAGIVVAMMAGALLIALLVSAKLQARISAPLLEVAQVAQGVIDHKDYSRRVVKRSEDEVGILVEAFNQMLTQIQQRERALQIDITELQQAEQALRESQQLLQGIIDNSPAVIYVKSLDGRYLLVNRRFSELFQFSKEAIVGKTDHDIFAKPAADAFRAVDQRVAAAGHALTMEETAPQDDGLHTYISVKCPLWDNAGKLYAVFGISTDITDRERAAQRLRTQLERLSLLGQITRAIGERQDLQSIFQVVIGRLEDQLPIDFGCVCAYDPVQESLTVTCVGAKSEVLARELAMPEHARISLDQNGLFRCVHGELVHEPDLSQVAFPFPQRLAQHGLRSLVMAPLQVESSVFGVLVAARREVRSFSSGDCEFLRQLGEQVALAAHQAQLYTALQQAYDELRQTQLAVAQQERLRALGQMASGIAHDINNALSPVALYTESLLEKEPNLSARGREYLKTIGRAIDDVAATVARMRESYRQREPQLSLAPVQLNQLVQQVVNFTRARWSDMPQQRGVVIKMLTELAPDLPIIMGVESEIREALTNLIFNAVDAMPAGGSLTLRTGVAQSATNSTESPAPRHVDVEVSDTGVGMDEEIRRRCLEPFFTTKGERGTGLGLAMVYGAVERHSAEIEIESTVGKGTTVRLSFPVPATVVGWPAHAELERAVPSRLRILVVDDDPLLLQSLRDTLEADGHLVVTANGGQAGIDAFRAARQGDRPFAVVITDLGMPYVDGRQVASAVKVASASTPVILLTGWGQRLAAEGAGPPHVDRILGKPPKLRELREALAACCQPVGA